MKLAKHIEALPSSYIREILAATDTENFISLAGGLPSAEHFPLSIVSGAIEELKESPLLFQYGATQGYSPLIEHLKHRQGVSADQDLLVTNGAQQGIDLVARAFVDPGDHVLIEAPGYLGAIQAFALNRAHVDSIPLTASGPNIEQLRQKFSQRQYKIFYCTPDFQNPSGICWSLEVRKAVAKLCQEFGVLLLEDCPYRELRFSGNEHPKVSEFCPEQSIVLSSFSKTTMPAMRLGCLHAKQDWIKSIEKIKQAMDLHTNIPLQHVLLHLLENKDFEQHLKRLRGTYQARYETLEKLLKDQLADYGEFNKVEGGMFVWFQLSQHSAAEVAQATLQEGLAVVPGPSFYIQQESAPSALRLNFSHSDEATLSQGVNILSKILKEGEVKAKVYVSLG